MDLEELGGGGGICKRDFEQKNIGSRGMRFQTNIGYANSKKWDGVWFKKKKLGK